MKHDIVYILKNDYKSDEIYYSLRSVCANFPHRKVWIYGGVPAGVNVNCVEFLQEGDTKWNKVTNTIKAICKNEDITDDFWLFNDDFFIMKKVKSPKTLIGGSLWARVNAIEKKYGSRPTAYSDQLKETAIALKRKGYDRLDYALHAPMLINKEQALAVIKEFKGYPMFRSIYGNRYDIKGVYSDDVKVLSLIDVPKDATYISTDDKSFAEGEVGKYIRETFPDRCKYEQGRVER